MDAIEKKYPNELDNTIEINQEKLIINTDFSQEKKPSISPKYSRNTENAENLIKKEAKPATLHDENVSNQLNLEEYSDEYFSIQRVIKNMDSEIIF